MKMEYTVSPMSPLPSNFSALFNLFQPRKRFIESSAKMWSFIILAEIFWKKRNWKKIVNDVKLNGSASSPPRKNWSHSASIFFVMTIVESRTRRARASWEASVKLRAASGPKATERGAEDEACKPPGAAGGRSHRLQFFHPNTRTESPNELSARLLLTFQILFECSYSLCWPLGVILLSVNHSHAANLVVVLRTLL